MKPRFRIGVLGAGAMGGTLGSLLVKSGHTVMLSSRHPDVLANRATDLGCCVGTLGEAADFGEIVIAALPLHALDDVPARPLAEKIVVDAMNYYPERDGVITELDEHRTTTSERVARHLNRSRVVKAFNAILAHDLRSDRRPLIDRDRRALPIAGDDAAAKVLVADLYVQLGFDALDAGTLADSWRFERAKPAYCFPLTLAQLRHALACASPIRRGNRY